MLTPADPGAGNVPGHADVSELVFLIDVDNTLLDNDRFSADLDQRLTEALGPAGQQRYRALYDSLRAQRGYADYIEPLQQMRRDFESDPDLLQLSGSLLDYPFAERLYPGALGAIAHLRTIGSPVILSDGDVVFQPRKIRQSGLWDAVEGRVLVYLHKEHSIDAVQQIYPARHYAMIDDKPRLLAAIKGVLGARVTTVFVRQGHYAREPGITALQPPPDLVIEHIADLSDMERERFLAPSSTFQEHP